MRTKDFEYELPPELIAQEPAPERSSSRLMLVDRATGAVGHYHASDLPKLLKPGDLIVVNDTRVIPARVFGRKEKTGGRVEVLFIAERGSNTWEAFLHSSGRPKAGDILELANGKIMAGVKSTGEYGRVVLEVSCRDDFTKVLEKEGLPPLPPYIKRPKNIPENDEALRRRERDYERYQTVYAKVPGAIAAPTAGLHFTRDLLAGLRANGIGFAEITLHVGPGTFIPVKTERVEDHKMEVERYAIGEPAAAAVNAALAEKRRVVAVGTTVVRTLESAVEAGGRIRAGSGETGIFIHPPFRFNVVGALLTNFHLPKSTLLMLVSAFAGQSGSQAGLDLIRHAYEVAVKEKYRFYSYGDCMLIV